MEVKVGCGGWWAFEGGLVPYAQRFDFVELNASYYHLPPVGRALRWRREVPAGFEFAMKMPRARPESPAPLLGVLHALAVRYGVVHQNSPWWREALDLLHDEDCIPVLERRRGPALSEPLPSWVKLAEDPSLSSPPAEPGRGDLYARVFGAPIGVVHHLGEGMVDRVTSTVRERAVPARSRVRIVIHSYQMYDDAERIRRVLGTGAPHG